MRLDNETFEYKGRTFRLEVDRDEYMGPPWDEHDGHGPVSEWTRRAKHPGEMVLLTDRQYKRYYDFAEAVRIAKKDCWDTKPFGVGTKGERAHKAATADFNYLRRWCNGDWFWATIHVTLLGEDGEEQSDSYLGGIEWGYCFNEYIMNTAKELADELLVEVDEEAEKARIANRFKEAMECGL